MADDINMLGFGVKTPTATVRRKRMQNGLQLNEMALFDFELDMIDFESLRKLFKMFSFKGALKRFYLMITRFSNTVKKRV